ncbi:TPA: hypothetical protein ACWV5T_002346 [Salmonella enterica subsp. enterica serovar Muenchen]
MSITVANNFGAVTAVTGIQPVHHTVVMGEGAPVFSDALLNKLTAQNSTGLGSSSAPGTLTPTRPEARNILDVVNAYLKTPLTADEMALILAHRYKFEFTIGTGDRRADFTGRFRLITNWHGEDAENLLLTPEPWDGDPRYGFRLSFSGTTGLMTLTDVHAAGNTYGALRYLTIGVKT